MTPTLYFLLMPGGTYRSRLILNSRAERPHPRRKPEGQLLTGTELRGAISAALLFLHLPSTRKAHSRPPGAPAPTMKTLDQVEARTPIGPSTDPVTISVPGSYYFAGEIATNQLGPVRPAAGAPTRSRTWNTKRHSAPRHPARTGEATSTKRRAASYGYSKPNSNSASLPPRKV